MISSTSRSNPRSKNNFRVIFLLQFQLLAIAIGLVCWSVPYGLNVAKDASERDWLEESSIIVPMENRPSSNQTLKHQDRRRANKKPYQYNMVERIREDRKKRSVNPLLRPVSKYEEVSRVNPRRRPLSEAGKKRNARKRDRNKYPRVIFFVHIHKGAGTLFCSLVDLNEASINPHKNQNCNVQADQRCCGGVDSMEAQIEYANQTNFDMVAIEREMYESMAPDHYDYVVTLRDSKRRYYSHWGHLRTLIPIGPGIQIGGFGNSAWIYGNNTIVDIKTKKRRVHEGHDPLGSFAEWSEGQPDNWNTRILCGPRCRPQAKFQITENLFNYTLTRVERFAHFLFVEDMEASYNKFAAHYRLRKYSDMSASSEFVQKMSNRSHDKDALVRQERWNPLMSALDDALYEFAKRKYQNMTQEQLLHPFSNQALLDRYFFEGMQIGCADACCGSCTSY